MPPRMIDSQGLLDRVAMAAPDKRTLRGFDAGFARLTGAKPRTLLRNLDRARKRGTVSQKVADDVFGFLRDHEHCNSCGTWCPRGRWRTICCVCERARA